MEGGCGTLAPAYLKMVKTNRKNRNRPDPRVVQALQNRTYGKKTGTGYIDPNDPSIIYLEQPEVDRSINYNPLGYNPIPQNEPMQIRPGMGQQNNNPGNRMAQDNIISNNNSYNNVGFNKPQNNNVQFNNPYFGSPQFLNQFGGQGTSGNNMPPMNQMQNNVPMQNTPNMQNMNFMQPMNPMNPMQNNNNIPNNNYPSFDESDQNQRKNSDDNIALPSLEEINNANNNQYPQQGVEILNNVNLNQPQDQDAPKYFGFFGPSLQKGNQN